MATLRSSATSQLRHALPSALVLSLALGGLSAGLAHAAPLTAQTLTVTDCTSDSQLQQDVATANSDNAGDTITFACASGTGDIPLSKTLSITGKLTIDGSGAGQTITLDGHKAVQVLDITQTGSLTLSTLTVANGNVASGETGGGIENDGGMVTLTHSVVVGNAGNPYGIGGGITNGGAMNVTNSTVTDNTAGYGGGINNGGTMRVINSTVSGNVTTYGGGGGIYNTGTLSITSSLMTDNHADPSVGGGVFNATDGASGTLLIRDSTLTNNTANQGGGVYNGEWATTTIINSTVAGNYAGYDAGGIVNVGALEAGGNIIAQNSGENTSTGMLNCDNRSGQPIPSLGHNIENGTDCGFSNASIGDMQNTDPMLTALANNGGPTQTMALRSGSPAIGTIPASATFSANGATIPACPQTDQRGYPRPGNLSACDMGAYQTKYALDDDLTLMNMPANISANATSVNGAVVTYTPPSASDSDDADAPPVSCDHASGATYPIGQTTVTCSATDSDDLQPATGSFTVTVNAPGLNLHGSDFSGRNLTDTNLSGANLNGANLSGAMLASANLTGANLNKANLSNTDLTDADLTGANLNKATFTGANITGVTWGSTTTCPDGTNSGANGNTCVGHLG